MTVKRLCGNCKHYEPPKQGNAHGLCTVIGAFAGTLRPEPCFSCQHFEVTVPRRLPC